MRFFAFIATIFLLTSCWPESVSFVDKGGMNAEWKTFFVKTLENKAPNTSLSYPATLSEAVKDGIQNRTRLNLSNTADSAELEIEGVINAYSVTPIAIQGNDQASQNRLTVSVSFSIFIKVPEEDQMTLTSTRFIDYDSGKDLATIENTLLEEVTDQIVQDVINKLQSNW